MGSFDGYLVEEGVYVALEENAVRKTRWRKVNPGGGLWEEDALTQLDATSSADLFVSFVFVSLRVLLYSHFRST